MPTRDETKNRDALTQILDDVEKQAPAVEQTGQEIIKTARFTHDVVKSVRDFVSKIPNDDMLSEEEWQRAKDGWRAVRDAAQPILQTKGYIGDFTVSVSGSTFSSLSIVYTVRPVTPSFEPVVTAAKNQLAQIIDGIPLMDDVRKSMTRLGLDVRIGKRSALQLLEDAKLALDRPQTLAADGALPVLIALRECIEAGIGELLRRRPQQEETRKTADKIISIGKQCGRPNLPADHFSRLGSDCADLLNRLSGKKQATVLRTVIMAEFNEGLLFLKTLADSLDESKLRSTG